MRSPLGWLLAISMIGAAVAGCGTGSTPLGAGGGNSGAGGGVPQGGTAFIRIIMGSPDYVTPAGVAAVDVYIDGTRVWQNVSYGNFNGKAGGVGTAPFYVTSVLGVALSPSSHNVAVYPAGQAAGNASQLAAVTTAPGAARTTVVIADKVYGAVPLAIQALAFTEPIVSAPIGVSATVIMHHASPSGAPGVLAVGTLAVTTSSTGTVIKPTCKGQMFFSNPPTNLSMKVFALVNSGGAPIGYYVANSGQARNGCKVPLADFFPGTNATPPPPAPTSTPPSLAGYPNSGIIYPTPPPNPPGQPSPPPFDCDSVLPPTCNGAPPNPSAIPPNPLVSLPNLSLFALDAPAVPPSTVPGVLILGVFDPNQQ